ncbi:CU044_5270 family protein [Streptomyces marincola]|uniref:CU044_5270 family protein n=1 Tax=Streptomyces marincola TaxID=2878388 RepID=UPI001CF46F37|nr:CU044_5270 family protein [Streptomyces marincola]UCM87461.1 CU044_5270 family protein [Streptomyces marincola]
MNGFLPLPEKELPPGRHGQLKEFMMQEIQNAAAPSGAAPGRRRWARPAFAVPGLAGALALAVAAGIAVWGPDDAGRPIGRDGEATYAFAPNVNADTTDGAGELLLQVAAAVDPQAEDIRDDQWTYVRSREAHVTVNDHIETVLPPLSDQELWLPVDGPGKQHAPYDLNYRHLQTLPTDPDAMLEWLRSHQDMESDDRNYDQDAFVRASGLLRAPLMPPDVTAALLGALAQIPDVFVVRDAVDAAGRQGFAIVRYDSYNPGVRDEVLFDPGTLELLGFRSVATRATDTIEAGQVLSTTAVLERAVVDEDGQRP